MITRIASVCIWAAAAEATEFASDFENNDMDGWSCGAITACGGLGKICGGYKTKAAGQTIEKVYTGLPAGEYIFSMDFIKIDRWTEGEAYVHINGQEVWSKSGINYYDGTPQCGNLGLFWLSQYWNEAAYSAVDIPVSVSSPNDSTTVVVSASITGDAHQEYFAVDNAVLRKATPSPTPAPTVAPTSSPTREPTLTPTSDPTLAPSPSPTVVPTLPTPTPTQIPTPVPDTFSPTLVPNVCVMQLPFMFLYLQAPTANPTMVPTDTPTNDAVIYSTASFDDDDMKGWSCGDITSCGSYGKICGGYNTKGAGATIEKTYVGLQPGLYSISLDVIKIDSWDNEKAYVHINGQQAWTKTYGIGTGPENKCGKGGAWVGFMFFSWDENTENTGDLTFAVSDSGESILVAVSTSLNEGTDDESFGIDNVVLQKLPTPAPTLAPSSNPTRTPTPAPTFTPTTIPTKSPTLPTSAPTNAPTEAPPQCKDDEFDAQALPPHLWPDVVTFDNNDMDGWSCGAITTCSGLGKICGGYGTKGARQTIERTFIGLEAGEYSLSLDFIKIDGWAWERAYVHINGQQAWSQSGLAYYSGSGQCGQSSSWDAGPPYSFAFPIQSWNEKSFSCDSDPQGPCNMTFTVSGPKAFTDIVVSTSMRGPEAHIKSFAIDNIVLRQLQALPTSTPTTSPTSSPTGVPTPAPTTSPTLPTASPTKVCVRDWLLQFTRDALRCFFVVVIIIIYGHM